MEQTKDSQITANYFIIINYGILNNIFIALAKILESKLMCFGQWAL